MRLTYRLVRSKDFALTCNLLPNYYTVFKNKLLLQYNFIDITFAKIKLQRNAVGIRNKYLIFRFSK